jgi:DNA-binding NarL/FixJ family response regulator
MHKYKILLADDHKVVTAGIRSLMQRRTDLSIVGEVGDGAEVLPKTCELKPDIVIMDISMPHVSGVEAAQALAEHCPQVKIIIYTMHSDPRFILELFRTGISGLVMKEEDPQELIAAVDCVLAGGTAFGKYNPQRMVSQLLQSTADASETERIQELSPREAEIFKALADGHSIKHIALELHISPKTVETHKYNIFDKLHVETLTELTKLAIRHGVILA